MSQSAKAWFLYAADAASVGQPAEFVYGDLPLPDPGPRDVLVETLYGSWEGNMGHCVQRKPIDVARFRGEERVVIGNAGVVRVLSMGSEVKGWKEGQCALILPDSALDPWGYPTKAFAYDMAGTTGFLSTRMVLPASDLVPLPEKTRHSYAQWAGFSARYTTAWSNWRLAFGTYRLMVPHERNPSPHVWGWGGGTTLAELDLARRHGCTTVMLSASDERLELIRQSGVTALDRRRFGDLYYDELRAGTDGAYRRAYQQAEAAFVREVEERTGKRMVQIFVDYIGTPFFRATRRVLSREGVITTAGWKEGMATSFMRATECIERHQYIHTHMCTREEVLAAIEYGEREGWMPTVDARIHAFDEVPALSQKFLEGNVGFFPVFAVNPE